MYISLIKKWNAVATSLLQKHICFLFLVLFYIAMAHLSIKALNLFLVSLLNAFQTTRKQKHDNSKALK